MSGSQVLLGVIAIRLAGLVLAGVAITALPKHSNDAPAAYATGTFGVQDEMRDGGVAILLQDMRLHD